MDSNEPVASGEFSEEEKLTEGIDEDANWFSKNLEDESELVGEKEEEKVVEKPSEEMMETDSQSELLADIAGVEHQVNLEPKQDELKDLKHIAIDSKKHDISNELKEMFEEKSSDAEELQESALAKHSLDTEITKEDKLKDIVPEDILGKDDSFDGLDNDVLNQDLEVSLTYDKNQELISQLPDNSGDLHDESSAPPIEDNEQEPGHEEDTPVPEVKSLDELSFEGKTELLENLSENIVTKEIDEIMEQDLTNKDDSNKELKVDLKDITSELEDNSANEIKEDLENELQNITEDSGVIIPAEEMVPEQEVTQVEEPVMQIDKSSIEINQENMMVEFAHDSGNQCLIQIKTEQPTPVLEDQSKTESIVMETPDGQTLVFTTETMETSETENDVMSQVEGGAEFLQAVTGKLEDVLSPVKEDSPKKDVQSPTQVVSPVKAATEPAMKQEPKEDPPKCCISTCKSGKSNSRTTFRYFKPPVNKILYKKWEYIFHQAKQQITPDSLICEIHFRTGLIYKRGIDKTGKIVWALREGALPKLSPSGVLRVTGGVISPPSTTVQVTKKPEVLSKSPTTPVVKPATHSVLKQEVKTSPNVSPTTPRVLGKKILQKPVKTVATKVSNEVTDIGFLYKNPELVKAAQEDMLNMDILVCGECHSVFHILELFQAHKIAANCAGESNFKGNPSEPKPQVWAFLLWKSAQAKVADQDSSWKLYQRWCKLDERIRGTWIAVGKSLQEGHVIGSMKMTDNVTPYKPLPKAVGRPPLKSKEGDEEEITARKTLPITTKLRPQVDITPIVMPKTTPKDPEPEYEGGGDAATFSGSESMDVDDPGKSTNVMSDDEHGENKENDNDRQNKELDQFYSPDSEEIQNCTKCNELIKNLKGGILCVAGCYGYYHAECTRIKTVSNLSKLGSKKLTWLCDTCKFTDVIPRPVQQTKPKEVVPEKQPEKQKEENEEEFVVEKIVSRRYNIKKKHFEYLLKWEGYPSDQNTWEPAENLGTCQHLLKAFEEALAKQQAAKMAAMKAAGGVVPSRVDSSYKIKPPVMSKKKPEAATSTPLVNSLGRPVRSSKQKAMDQVKVWCGTIKPSEDDSGAGKRRASSDSEYEEDVIVKRVKVEVESEDSEAEPHPTPTSAKGRGRTAGSVSKTQYLNKPVVNGGKKASNLAAALGLESDEDEEMASPTTPTPSPSKPSLAVQNMSSLSPHNQQVLVASAKGVVTVDPKQVNLSSGVYIMSSKSGIVKVDNNKTLSTLQKSGIMKKPLIAGPKEGQVPVSTAVNTSSDVVVVPKSDAQQKGILRKPGVPGPGSTQTQTPGRPPGMLKPVRPGVTPRPLGLLKSGASPAPAPATPTPTLPVSTQLRPVTPAGTTARGGIQKTPLRGRPATSAGQVIRKPAPQNIGLSASIQQKLLIARKKSESEIVEVKPGVTISPVKREVPLMKPKLEPGSPALPPIKSTNNVLAHPMLNRGRGRGAYRGRGRGTNLMQTVQAIQRDSVGEPVKDSKLVDSDSLLMEFQEPSDSEESDYGVVDEFPKLSELPPIEPESPPRPLSLCPLTGKVLCKAEGEKTPEPPPPPAPKPPPLPPPSHPPLPLPQSQSLRTSCPTTRTRWRTLSLRCLWPCLCLCLCQYQCPLPCPWFPLHLPLLLSLPLHLALNPLLRPSLHLRGEPPRIPLPKLRLSSRTV